MLLLLALACAPTDDDGNATGDTAGDTAADTGPGEDTAPDSGDDTAADTGPDTAPDTAPDPGGDTAADTGGAPVVDPATAGLVVLGEGEGDRFGQHVLLTRTDGELRLVAGFTAEARTIAATSVLPASGTHALGTVLGAARIAVEPAELAPAGLLDLDGDGVDELVVVDTYCETSGWYQLCREDVALHDFPLTDGDIADARFRYRSAQGTDWYGWQHALPGDLDGDGLDELVHLEGGNGGARMVPVPLHAGTDTYWEDADAAAVADALGGPGDLDGDGLADLVWSSCAGAAAYVARGPIDWAAGLVAGTTVPHDACLTRFEAAGDVDGDGLRDLYAFAGDGPLHLLPGPVTDGALVDVARGTLGEARGEHALDDATALAAADLDGDGTADLAVADGEGTYVLLGPWSGAVTPADATAFVPGLGGADGTVASIDGVLALADPTADDLASSAGAVYLFTAF